MSARKREITVLISIGQLAEIGEPLDNRPTIRGDYFRLTRISGKRTGGEKLLGRRDHAARIGSSR